MWLTEVLRNRSGLEGTGWLGREREILTPDPAATYKASLETLIRGLATA